jgi:transposase
MTEIGIDISKATFDAAFHRSEKYEKAKFANNGKGRSEFHRWLKKNGITDPHLFMEATGRYGEALATWAHRQGWPVTVCNPRHVRRFAEATGEVNKSDPLDARCVTAFGRSCEQKQRRLWQPRTSAHNELRELHMELEGVKRMITADRNRSKSCLRSPLVKELIKRNIAWLQKLKQDIEKRCLVVIKEDPQLSPLYRELKKIKGFGDKTVIVLLARIDFDQFKKGRELVAYAGLAPRKWESGTMRKKEIISRVGHADLRAAMFLPAVVAMTHDPEIAEYKQHQKASGKPTKVIICAVMARLLRTAFARVRNLKRAAMEVQAA